MKLRDLVKKIELLAAVSAALAVGGGLLTSCSTAPPEPEPEPLFKFTVMLYPEPVEVSGWVFDRAQASNPEGAALNIATSMQHGEIDQWLASWAEADRPKLNIEQRDALLKQWQPLKDGRLEMVGRVVAGADEVVELSILDTQKKEKKIKLPLKYDQGQWWLADMDPKSECLNWESSTNKILAPANPFGLRTYLASVQGLPSK